MAIGVRSTSWPLRCALADRSASSWARRCSAARARFACARIFVFWGIGGIGESGERVKPGGEGHKCSGLVCARIFVFSRDLTPTGGGVNLCRALLACTRMFVFFGVGANGEGGGGSRPLRMRFVCVRILGLE